MIVKTLINDGDEVQISAGTLASVVSLMLKRYKNEYIRTMEMDD